MLLSRQQNGGQNHDIKIGNRCFGNVEQFRYLLPFLVLGYNTRNIIQERKTKGSHNSPELKSPQFLSFIFVAKF
jgi:hypothetical protein